MGFEILLLFPMCSHQVFNGFPKHSASSQRAPQHVLNSTLLHPISPTIGLYPTHNEWCMERGDSLTRPSLGKPGVIVMTRVRDCISHLGSQ